MLKAKRKVTAMRTPAVPVNPNADLDAAAAHIIIQRRMIAAQTAYRDAIMQRGEARAAVAQHGHGGVAQAEMAVANTRARMLDIEIEVATNVCNQQQAELDAEKARRGVV